MSHCHNSGLGFFFRFVFLGGRGAEKFKKRNGWCDFSAHLFKYIFFVCLMNWGRNDVWQSDIHFGLLCNVWIFFILYFLILLFCLLLLHSCLLMTYLTATFSDLIGQLISEALYSYLCPDAAVTSDQSCFGQKSLWPAERETVFQKNMMAPLFYFIYLFYFSCPCCKRLTLPMINGEHIKYKYS